MTKRHPADVSAIEADRPLLAAFCLVLGTFHFAAEYTPGLTRSLIGVFRQTWVLTIRPVTDLGVWFGIWRWTQLEATASAWLYGLVLVGLGVAAYREFSPAARRAGRAFFAANLLAYWLMTLFWDQYGVLGEFLFGTVVYTVLMGGGIWLFHTAGVSVASGDGAPAGATDERSTSGATSSDAAADEDDAAGDETGSWEASAGGSSAAAEHEDAREAPDGVVNAEAEASEPVEDGDPAAAGGPEEAFDTLQAALAAVDDPTTTSAAIRGLGAKLPADGLPEDAVAALERHADADDPDVRLAVGEVCATVEDERAEAILKRLRLDPDDRVVRVAVNGLT